MPVVRAGVFSEGASEAFSNAMWLWFDVDIGRISYCNASREVGRVVVFSQKCHPERSRKDPFQRSVTRDSLGSFLYETEPRRKNSLLRRSWYWSERDPSSALPSAIVYGNSAQDDKMVVAALSLLMCGRTLFNRRERRNRLCGYVFVDGLQRRLKGDLQHLVHRIHEVHFHGIA
jgi:hypothetical protein